MARELIVLRSDPPGRSENPAHHFDPLARPTIRRSTELDFEAVVFDLDGLMIDSEPVYARAWKRFSMSSVRPTSYSESL